MADSRSYLVDISTLVSSISFDVFWWNWSYIGGKLREFVAILNTKSGSYRYLFRA